MPEFIDIMDYSCKLCFLSPSKKFEAYVRSLTFMICSIELQKKRW